MSSADQRPEERCLLCGEPLRDRASRVDRFCCAGCQAVHAILGHLDDSAAAAHVEAARRMGLIQGAAPDEPGYPPDPAAMRDERFRCAGLSCPSCAWIVEQVLLATDGVEQARVDYFSGSCQVRYDMRRVAAEDLRRTLAPLGYGLQALEDEGRAGISRTLTRDFVICAVLLMNIMGLASLRYFERAGWLDHAPALLGWIELVLTLPVLLIGWVPSLRRAWAGLRVRRVTMDFLIACAVGAAAVLSLAALTGGRDEIFFETAAGLVTISLLGRMIEARLRQRAFRDLSGMMRMRVVHARQVAPGGEERYVAVDGVEPGDRVVVLQGEVVPFDGEVAEGRCVVSEAVLTGEPTPLGKVAGDAVVAGSSVLEGRLELQVRRRLDQTLLHRITEALREGLSSSEGRLRAADRVATYFAPGVLAVALGVWLARLGHFGLEYALSADGWFPSVAVLAVACPCAFSLAGVTAVTTATGALLRRGLLVKEAAQLEELHRVDHVVLDKTGTITEGRMSVEHLIWRDDPRPELLPLLLAAESGSLHPVAHAVRAHLAVVAAAVPEEAVEDLPGLGRQVRVEGRRFQVGSGALLAQRFEVEQLAPRHTVVWFGYEGRADGALLIADAVRPGAREALARLARAGCTLELVSGDRQETTDFVAAEVGLERARGGVSLEQKVALVRERREEGRVVAFVGDGTNDALAMSEAVVSVAVSRSTDEALAASGFVTIHGDVDRLPGLLATGRKLARVIRSNYVWAFAFNTLFIPVAAAGELVPVAAMLLMLLSSAAVLLNSLRVRRA